MESADVIVVGAGALGCNAAWHLQEAGLDVLVIDAEDGPAHQTTRAAAGFVSRWSAVHIRPWDSTHWQMENYGIDFYTRLAGMSRRDFGFYPCGAAYIDLEEGAWHDHQSDIDRARRLGTDLEILTSERTSELLPLLRHENLAGVSFDPKSVRVRGLEVIAEMADQLEQRGVRFVWDTRVTGIEQHDGHIAGIETDHNFYKCAHAIIAAGAWTNALLSNSGVNLPVTLQVKTHYTTKPLPGVGHEMPMMLFHSPSSFYIREENGGLLLGGGGESSQHIDPMDPPHCHDILPDLAYQTREKLRMLESVMPVLKEADIGEIKSGLATLTEDRGFIADKIIEIEGLHVLTACQEAGVTHGPALGRLLTELITEGHSAWHIEDFRLSRFQSGRAEGCP